LNARFSDPIEACQGGVDPKHEALLSDPVDIALLVVLDNLSPTERRVFVLHNIDSATAQGHFRCL
jgi:hypothetical protein